MRHWQRPFGSRPGTDDAGGTAACCCCCGGKDGRTTTSASTGFIVRSIYRSLTAANVAGRRTEVDSRCPRPPSISDGLWISCRTSWPMAGAFASSTSWMTSAAAVWPMRWTPLCLACVSAESSMGSLPVTGRLFRCWSTMVPNSAARHWTSGPTGMASVSTLSLRVNPPKTRTSRVSTARSATSASTSTGFPVWQTPDALSRSGDRTTTPSDHILHSTISHQRSSHNEITAPGSSRLELLNKPHYSHDNWFKQRGQVTTALTT